MKKAEEKSRRGVQSESARRLFDIIKHVQVDLRTVAKNT
jgi:hypothetical protein